MLPHQHAIVSASVGVLGWWWTGDPVAGAAALAAGVLPDADHVVDYLIYHRRGEHLLVLPLHGYEYACAGMLLALIGHNRVLGIASLAYLVHLLTDQMTNHTHKLGYFILFRARHRFQIEDISLVPADAKRGRMDDMHMVKRLFRQSRRNPC